ncbi:MAG TPA: GNAT family N-acetyltransferase, partial [Actinomycetes bacterium]|nr:GNAT family N-acetyltransferase [Actinomycetes bacterium]
VFLSAGSDDVARIYERVGFQRIATACIAEPG